MKDKTTLLGMVLSGAGAVMSYSEAVSIKSCFRGILPG